MGQKPKIDLRKLDQMLRDGLSQTQIAKFFKVTPGAITLAKKNLKTAIVRTVGLERANEVVEGHIDMMGQLRKVNKAINDELDRARESAVSAKGKDRVALQELIIKLTAEVRRQLDSQLKILEVWHDMKIVAEFQQEVLGVLDEMEPGLRNEVLKRLKERRALRGTVRLS